ncbi:MAG: HAMP domain-containing sensor histidine kinase [Eggerthellaceae bacterium]|nr:HAMP domain-containing sensor histidine kinase [Eggerthellaceae bacterium]
MKKKPRAKSERDLLVSFRRQFVVANVVFVALVLAVATVAVGVFTFQKSEGAVYDSLQHRVTTNQGLRASGALGKAILQSERSYLGDGGETGGARRDAAGDITVATSSYFIGWDGAYTTYEDVLDLDASTLSSALSSVYGLASSSGGLSVRGKLSSLNLYFVALPTDDGVDVALASTGLVERSVLSVVGAMAGASLGILAVIFIASMVLSKRAVAPVDRAWRRQRQFIADASHELKTPLTVILANNALLRESPEQTVANQMKWIDSTDTEAHLMQGLVDDMLYLAKVEDDGAAVVNDRVDMDEVAEGVVLTFESVAFDRGLELESHIAPGAFVLGQRDRLARMLATLVDNACKYADAGGKVDVDLAVRGGQCVVRVRNTGAPIAAEDLPHLFDRFYRADKARTSGKGGYGLGLSIAQTIARDHGGDISAASSASDGTVFTVTLPLAK